MHGLLVLLLFCLAFSLQKSAADEILKVMTYNIRYASSKPPNSWPERKPLIKEVIEEEKPDVIGTQEGLYPQLLDLAYELEDYEWIGLGRDGGSKGEFMAVFFLKNRLRPMAFDHFWLSDTPNVIGSTTWGNSNRRMVTWVRFEDKKTRQQFYFFNTHFDHEIQAAREKSAELVLQRINEMKTSLPIILAGDFNASAPANKVYQTLTGPTGLLDTWELAKERKNDDVGTFNGFSTIPKGGPRIDWILVRPELEVEKTEIITFEKGGKFPSDHFPVVAWIRFTSIE